MNNWFRMYESKKRSIDMIWIDDPLPKRSKFSEKQRLAYLNCFMETYHSSKTLKIPVIVSNSIRHNPDQIDWDKGPISHNIPHEFIELPRRCKLVKWSGDA